MKIERVDDTTVKCFLSNEELEAYQIDYKDFILRSDKAKEVVQEIIEQAEEEVGYKPPRYAFDLQIMYVPQDGLVLTLSESDPMDSKEGRQFLQALQELHRIASALKEQTKSLDAAGIPGGDMPQGVQIVDAVFVFRSIGRVMEFAAVLPKNLRVKSSLYRNEEGQCFLILSKGTASEKRYGRTCVQALEFGSLYGADEQCKGYVIEHAECLIPERALQKLRM